MGGLWLGGAMMANNTIANRGQSAGAVNTSKTLEQGAKLKDLEDTIARLSMLNQALWEILSERLQITEAELEQKAYEVDMRDGVEDGKITASPVKCPSCQRVSNSKHGRCLYCGQMFEKPIFG